eukprot:9897679-Alexandrium_andersonii.AAC.1
MARRAPACNASRSLAACSRGSPLGGGRLRARLLERLDDGQLRQRLLDGLVSQQPQRLQRSRCAAAGRLGQGARHRRRPRAAYAQ